MKIRSHLVILVLGAVLPILAFSAVMTGVFWRQQRTAFDDRFLDRVRAMAIALDRELDGNIRALEVLGQSPYLRSGDLQRFYEHAERARATQPTWRNVILIDAASGRQALNLRRPFGMPLPPSGLDQAVLMEMVKADRRFVAPLSKGPVSGEYATRVMVPVGSNPLQPYVLVAVIDQASWLKFLSSYPVAPDATMTMLDQNGIIIARTLNNDQWVGKPPSAGLTAKTRAAPEGAYRNRGLEGQMFYAAHSRSKISGWTIATGVPVAGVEGALRGSTAAMAAGALAMALLAVGLAFLFGSRVAGPVSALARSAGALSGSAPAAAEKESTIAEVAEVSRAFQAATERLKVHDEELRYQTQLLETITDHAPSMLVMLDVEGRVTYANPAVERLTGYRPEEIIGRLMHERLHHSHPDGRPYPVEECFLNRALGLNQTVRDLEESFIRKNGTFFDALCSASPIYRSGVPVGTVVEVQDISQRKRYEENLEKRVAERTAELERTVAQREKLQEQLFESQKMESLGTLAGGIAHDFNNLLNIILGYASTLSQAPRGPIDASEGLQAIRDAAERGAALVQQLLTVAHKGAIEFEPVDLNGFVRGLAKLLSETFPKTIALSLDLDPALPPILADPNRLHQALLNLCVNARDAMPDGGALRLATERASGAELQKRFQAADRKEYVSISVEDTGQGIDPVLRERVFDPFFTTKEPGRGTGLGLTVAYGIVGSHKGFIEVESAPGRGTTFRVYLPLRAAEGRREPPPAVPLARAARGHGTILFVDDENRQVDLIKGFLEEKGYRVLVARDGVEAVEIHRLHKNEVAAVVLDLGLPKLSGWEAFLKMKQEQPGVKTVFTSGYIKADIRSEMVRQGVAAIIHKPYLPDELLAKLVRAVGERTAPSTEAVPENDRPLER